MIAIATFASAFGEIEILKCRATGSRVYLQAGCYQTETDESGVSVVPYIHAIFGFLVQANARNVLMIGCGGGSLGTMLAKAGIGVMIVDDNPAAFAIARDYFGLPKTIDCRVADGEEFLLRTGDRYEAIVMDAFKGDRIPHHLRTSSFFRLARSRLDRSRGCLLANVHVQHDLDMAPDQYAGIARNVWNEVRLLDTRGAVNRNALVLAGDVKNLRKPKLLVPPLTGGEDIALHLDRMNFRACSRWVDSDSCV